MRAITLVMIVFTGLSAFSQALQPATAQNAPISDLSQDCISCHSTVTPAIVDDWKRSRHSSTSPRQAMAKPELSRRMSARNVPESLGDKAVGCAECHTINASAHKDTFEHNDQKVHLLVTPKDCSTCHPSEVEQYAGNTMSHARGNLINNKIYQGLATEINGVQTFKNSRLSTKLPDEKTSEESCLHCHGTAVEVKGLENRETDFGEMEFPVLTGWPNQGVGRSNPDDSLGCCTSCHTRHQFSIKMARKPYTCSQCHKGPDVPAYKAYSVSKHGNIFSSMEKEWDFSEVPWTVGKDFTAPTCAACHVSLVVNSDGKVVSQRTHRMNERFPWRILGLVYAHPYPKSADTSIIVNADGQQLPTTLSGNNASKFLIGESEMAARTEAFKKVCLSCHAKQWVDGHWERFENTIKTTNEMTLASTQVLQEAWAKGAANPANIFDEPIEKMWTEQWLFFANATRFASAMMGADYGVFANGRWSMSKNLRDMADHLSFLLKGAQPRQTNK